MKEINEEERNMKNAIPDILSLILSHFLSLCLSLYSDSFLHFKPIFVSLYITQMCLLHYISRIVLIFSQLIALLLPLSYYLSLP